VRKRSFATYIGSKKFCASKLAFFISLHTEFFLLEVAYFFSEVCYASFRDLQLLLVS